MRARFPAALALVAAAFLPPPAAADMPAGSQPPRPHIVDISPSSGPPGTRLTIAGSSFRPGATVLVGGVEAEIESESEVEIVAIVGPHRPGRVSVEVRNRDGSNAVRGWGFRYLSAGAGGVPAPG